MQSAVLDGFAIWHRPAAVLIRITHSTAGENEPIGKV
jgi:hypothetical protein